MQQIVHDLRMKPMKRCPLTDATITKFFGRLPDNFTTDDFICECPHSGGDALASGCEVVQERGRRSVCGRRVSKYQKPREDILAKDNSVSPARWTKLSSTTVGPASKNSSAKTSTRPTARRRRSLNTWEAQMRQHQIRWKDDVARVGECGQHGGDEKRYLFPRHRWMCNILPSYRSTVAKHLQTLGIAKHSFLHHVLSSQAFAFNLAAPFIEQPAMLTPVLRSLLPDDVGDQIYKVVRVETEVDGGKNYFNEPSRGSRGDMRTSADIGVWWQALDGTTNLVLIEVKFTESEFGHCAKGQKHGGVCDNGGNELVATYGHGCPLQEPPHQRTYWTLIEKHDLFDSDTLSASKACPFRADGYQLMRNQLLAAVMEDDPDQELGRVDFAILTHDDNPDILALDHTLAGETTAESGWRAVLRRPERFHSWRASYWIRAAAAPDLDEWTEAMFERYFPPNLTNVQPLRTEANALAAQQSHHDCVDWMRSRDFAAYKRLCDKIVGPGRIYFRATGNGIVQIALTDDAPGYVGFRTNHSDRGHLLKPHGTLPGREHLERRWQEFSNWVTSVRRISAEEQAVIPWIRRALTSGLRLDEMGDGWIFLNQEWRFLDSDGNGKKSDVLAVHLPSGRLGIVEFKDALSKRSEAVDQVAGYRDFWMRDREVLADFFTAQLRAMGNLYGNEEAVAAHVRLIEPVLFFGWPDDNGIQVEHLTPGDDL
jgi:hypothetical protein